MPRERDQARAAEERLLTDLMALREQASGQATGSVKILKFRTYLHGSRIGGVQLTSTQNPLSAILRRLHSSSLGLRPSWSSRSGI